MSENITPGNRLNGGAGDGMGARPSPRRPEPDAHGQAALLLAESILHTLIKAKVLTTAQAASSIRTACEVKEEVAQDTDESEGRMQESLNLLSGIERSLSIDEDR